MIRFFSRLVDAKGSRIQGFKGSSVFFLKISYLLIGDFRTDFSSLGREFVYSVNFQT